MKLLKSYLATLGCAILVLIVLDSMIEWQFWYSCAIGGFFGFFHKEVNDYLKRLDAWIRSSW